MNTLSPSDRSYSLYRSSDTSSYLCKLDIPTLARSTVNICYRPSRSLLSRCICCCLNWSVLSHCNLYKYLNHCILSSQWSTKSISHKFYPLAQSYPDKCTCCFLVQNDLLICMYHIEFYQCKFNIPKWRFSKVSKIYYQEWIHFNKRIYHWRFWNDEQYRTSSIYLEYCKFSILKPGKNIANRHLRWRCILIDTGRLLSHQQWYEIQGRI